MKKLAVLVGALMLMSGQAGAATLLWDRNGEPDLKDYLVYACFTPNCVLVKSAATLQPGTVLQPAVGVVPSYSIDLAGKEGAIGVSARDLSTNESAISVPLPFDQSPPAIPANPRLQ